MTPTMATSERLQKFIDAQDDVVAGRSGVSEYELALSEMREGRKTTHWIWFIFPQIPLGTSPMAVKYAIDDRQHALDFISHGILGPRLRQITSVALEQLDPPNLVAPRSLMGSDIDCKKLASSMTLFSLAAAAGDEDFRQVCNRVLTHLATHGHPECNKTKDWWSRS